jgi:hypothetical protein
MMMNGTRKADRRDDRNPATALDGLAPAIRSAVGVIGEGSGFFRNVAALGIALVSEASKAEPRQPTILAPNVFSFPTARPTKRTK